MPIDRHRVRLAAASYRDELVSRRATLVAAARVAEDGTVEQATLFCLVHKFKVLPIPGRVVPFPSGAARRQVLREKTTPPPAALSQPLSVLQGPPGCGRWTLRAEMPARQFVRFCRSSVRSNLAPAAPSPGSAAAAATPAQPPHHAGNHGNHGNRRSRAPTRLARRCQVFLIEEMKRSETDVGHFFLAECEPSFGAMRRLRGTSAVGTADADALPSNEKFIRRLPTLVWRLWLRALASKLASPVAWSHPP